MANSPSFGNAVPAAARWEVELKFPIADLTALGTNLDTLGARFSPPIQQTDHYFNHPARDFSQTDEALRIRQVGTENYITYKGPKLDPATKTRKEIELLVAPGAETPARFQELLIALGFRYVGAVKKARRIARVAWQDHIVELALDEVIGLGSFLELEISADDDALERAKVALQALASLLNLRSQERRSYLELLMHSSS
jgi:adenylate cyclase, class 2